ncbi:unnamed protein product [Porites evermanni]|uniref:Replication protein A OB domain-containing protein n=1 Tax=Porites evermanni TaxID=104178 RepID=A0ABN8MM64_9CNID|nr:unnamed protein product [Porites evermanni]
MFAGVSNRHFEQLSRTAENLEFLDISNCSSLEQSSIFQAKKAFSRLEYVDISDDLIVNKRSRIQDASNTDIDFEYLENSQVHDANTVTLIGNIPSLAENIITSIQGVVTMSLEHIKEVTTKTADTIPMLDHFVVTDNTGTIRLTLWGSTIKEITNNNSYMTTNLRVKSFDAMKYLTTTPTTTIQGIEEQTEDTDTDRRVFRQFL